MSQSFTKLFSSITESTVWGENHATRIVWITMLAMADRKGRVEASIPGLANRARVTLEECEHALERFMAPDKYSRTPDNDGRRIERIDGGWALLNYAKYREMRDHDARLEYQREWDRLHRRNGAENPTLSDKSDQIRPRPTKAEADTEESKASRSSRLNGARQPHVDDSPVVQTLPLVDGTQFEVRQSLVAELEPLYPKVDIPATVNEMKGWLIGHKERRKTRRGIKAFITTWLQKEQANAEAA